MDARQSVGRECESGKRHARKARCTNRRRARLSSGRVALVAGGRTRCCAGCAVRESWVVADYIRMGLEDVPIGTWVAFFTLTEPGEFRSVEEHCNAFDSFKVDLWALLGGPREYVAVREFQKRGAVHTHMLVVGWSRVDLEELRAIIVKHGYGRIFNVRSMRTGGHAHVKNVAAYMAKTFGGYLSKQGKDEELYRQAMELLPPGRRLVHHSRGWAGGITLEDVRAARRRRMALDGRLGVASQAAESNRVLAEARSALYVQLGAVDDDSGRMPNLLDHLHAARQRAKIEGIAQERLL